MQSAYSTFVSKLEEDARHHLRRQLDANTSQFTLATLMQRLDDLDAAGVAPLGSPSSHGGGALGHQVDLEDEEAAEEEAAAAQERVRDAGAGAPCRSACDTGAYHGWPGAVHTVRHESWLPASQVACVPTDPVSLLQ